MARRKAERQTIPTPMDSLRLRRGLSVSPGVRTVPNRPSLLAQPHRLVPHFLPLRGTRASMRAAQVTFPEVNCALGSQPSSMALRLPWPGQLRLTSPVRFAHITAQLACLSCLHPRRAFARSTLAGARSFLLVAATCGNREIDRIPLGEVAWWQHGQMLADNPT